MSPRQGIVDVRPLNRAIIQDSMPVIHDAETRERLMLSYANGNAFRASYTVDARRNIAALCVCICVYGVCVCVCIYIFRILHIARANAG